MNIVRAGLSCVGTTLFVAWCVTVTVRSTIGAPDPNPMLAVGPLPPAPPSLAPLLIPRRDPFSADVQKRPEQLAPGSTAVGGKSDVGGINVPDVAAFAASNNFGVVATIVGHDESYALVEEGSAVHVVHVGDRFASSVVAEIGVDHVRLANGTQIAMAQHGGSAPGFAVPPASIAVASPSPSPSPQVSSSPLPLPVPAFAPVNGVQQPVGTVVQPHPDIGRPNVVQPNGTAARVNNTVFPSTFPTPSVVPMGGTMPGGHP